MQILAYALILRTATAITTYYMNDLCGSSIDVGLYDQVRLKLMHSSSSYHNRPCQLQLSTFGSNKRLMVYFKSMNIHDTSVYCSNNYLEMHDGSSTSSSCLGSCKRCGYSSPSGVFTTTGNNLLLNYDASSSYSLDDFDMVITSYHRGICYSYEYSCNNGRCIDNSLTCNSYNPCGDYSDCDVVLTVGGIAGVVIGCAVFVTVVIIVIIICRRRRTIIVQRNSHVPVPVAATVPPTSYGYNQPVPAQYPAPAPAQYPPPAYTENQQQGPYQQY